MSLSASLPRRVVVTGMGAVSPLGLTLKKSWEAMLRNEGGMTTLEEALVQHQGLTSESLDREMKIAKSLPCQVAAPVKGIECDSRTARFVEMALLASSEAFGQSQLQDWLDQDTNGARQERIGVCVGSGMSGVREISRVIHTVDEKGIRHISPHFVPKILINSAAGRLAIEYGLKGPNHSVSTACATGAHAIGDAMQFIQTNKADVMLSGGAEACIDPWSLAGFCRLRALSTNFPPQESSRPFDKLRDGFVMGEGAAIIVLEELNHALNRGAPILAELQGYGLSGDAFHITAPDENGAGAERAMMMALTQAGSDGSDVGYVNAHATSTPKGDEIEARVIDRVLPASRRSAHRALYVSSSKGATGHLLGAAGALEAAFTVMSIFDQTIPPTRNMFEVDERPLGFLHATETVLQQNLAAAMSNSFGFGGTNACLLFRRFEDN